MKKKSAPPPKVKPQAARESESLDIDIKTQNEKLSQTRADLEDAYRQYADLYDFAPVGYFTLTRDGTIREVNLAGANLLGMEREKLINQRMELFIADKSRGAYRAFFEKLLSCNGKKAYELAFLKNDSDLVWARVEATCFEGGEECRAVLMDINERVRMAALLQARVRIGEFAESHTLDEVLQNTLDEAEALTDSLIGFAHFLQADQKTLDLQMWSTNTIKNMCTAEGKGQHYNVDQAGVWVDCVHTHTPVIHNDYPNLAHRKGLPSGHAPILREMVVPIMKNDLVVMVMGVGNKSAYYNEKDVAALSQLANLAWDIIQRKRAEDALKKSEEKYRLLHESMMDGFVSVDMNGEILEYNEIYRNMLGYAKDELAQLTYMDITPKKWRKFEAAIVENQILKRGHSDVYEKEYLRKDGAVFPVELRAVLLRDEEGNPARIWAVVRDISKRKESEDALRQSNELFSLFMLHSPVYAYIKSVTPTESRVLQASENYIEMIGVSGKDMIGKTMEELFPPEFAAKITADDWHVVSKGETIKLDEDLNDRHYTSIKFPIKQGNKTLLAGYTIDITERVRAEQALIVANNELKVSIKREKRLAHTDVLTGINNRRYLYQLAEHEFEIAARYKQPLSVLLFDADHFKEDNDTFGHAR
ncbi:MAG: PAS domain S-box protein, partial [Anaerolineales bacterium]|nr:PAS domain S-box protein [Anaerolineales bacterium]